MKKITSCFLSMILITILFTSATYASTPQVTAPNAILMDFHTGEVLFEHNAHEVTFPASTTKVLTAILVLENANLDDVVSIDYDLTVGGASMYLLKGESFTVKELLHALLIRSANDVAEALAIHVSGSVEEFAKLANQRAMELGATKTHFTNPHGMPDEAHVTTAHDLAIFGKHAMGFPVFREIVSTTNVVFDETAQTPAKRYYRSSNRFLWGTGSSNKILYKGQYINIKYDLIDGVKTGYTRAAQQCLISSAIKDDHRLIAVVLGAQGSNVYLDTRTLIDYGYENYKSHPLIEANELETEIPIKNGMKDSISLYTESNLKTILPIDQDPSTITKEVLIDKNITAPIHIGDTLGKIVYTQGDKTIGEVNLIAQEEVEVKPLLIKAKTPFKYLIYIALLFIIWKLFVYYLRFQKRKRKFIVGEKRPSLNFSKNLLKRR